MVIAEVRPVRKRFGSGLIGGFAVKILLAFAAGGVAVAAASLLVSATVAPREAKASMKFTQSTGKPCLFCHVSPPPALNATGKAFKAKGNKL